MKERSIAVSAFACVVAVLVLISAYFTGHNGGIDEIGLLNPSYMLATFGRLTYPVHGFFDEPVIVHPPIHVGWIGILVKLGLSWHYAEATPATVLFLLMILVTVRGPFPDPVKLAILFAIGFTLSMHDALGFWFGTRPEGEVHAAWFTGLLLLETGRLRGWKPRPLLAGAALVTYAAGIHYYALPVLAAIPIYGVWALRSENWKAAKRSLLALAAGACLIAIPYAAFYLIPNLTIIRSTVSAVQGTGTIAESIQTHLQIYRDWTHQLPGLIAKPLGWGVPLSVFSIGILGAIRSTRGIALSALPWQLIILLLAYHKHSAYLVHEVFLFIAAAAAGVLAAGDWLAARLPRSRTWYPALAAILMCAYLLSGSPLLRAATFTATPRIHEAELARAASRKILGPDAAVVGRIGAWYSSGAAYWREVTWDILSEPDLYPPKLYFASFDAAADYSHRSGDGLNHDHTMSSWYAEGLLHLRGFFIGEVNSELQVLYLSVERPQQVSGYASIGKRLYRFDERSGGDHEVRSVVCRPGVASIALQSSLSAAGVAHVVLDLPKGGGNVVTTLTPSGAPPADPGISNCTALAVIRGSIEPADPYALVAELRRTDKPIEFLRQVDDAPKFSFPLAKTLTPPPDMVRLNKVLNLAATVPGDPPSRIERTGNAIRVITDPRPGRHGALIPLFKGAQIDVPAWVQLRLRVKKGRFGMLTWGLQNVIRIAPAYLFQMTAPLDVGFAVPNLRNCDFVILYNALPRAESELELLDASVAVTQEVWGANKEALSALR